MGAEISWSHFPSFPCYLYLLGCVILLLMTLDIILTPLVCRLTLFGCWIYHPDIREWSISVVGYLDWDIRAMAAKLVQGFQPCTWLDTESMKKKPRGFIRVSQRTNEKQGIQMFMTMKSNTRVSAHHKPFALKISSSLNKSRGKHMPFTNCVCIMRICCFFIG